MSKLNLNTQVFKILLSIIMLSFPILMASCGVVAPSTTPTLTATSTQTATVTPTIIWFPATETPTPVANISPTPQPTFESQREGISSLLVDDDFSSQPLWQTSQGTSGNVAFGINALTLAVAQPSATLTSISQHALPEDFYLEISMQISLCQPEDQIGILFWYKNPGDTYRLLMTCSGEYRLELIQGGQSIVIQDWTLASQMNLAMPATNRIGLWVYQGRFQLYIDNVFQFEESIARDQNGGLGLFARTIEGNAMTIRFSDLQIYQINIQE
jgi:hypothetical protein